MTAKTPSLKTSAQAQEVEKRTEELAARLDRLSDAVNGVFRAALRLRNAELDGFAVGPAARKASAASRPTDGARRRSRSPAATMAWIFRGWWMDHAAGTAR